jgi:hypothetical protein
MGIDRVKRSSRRKADPLLPQYDDDDGVPRCGSCGRAFLLLLPILGCSFILATLYLLVYRLNVSIKDVSVSQCLADYEPKIEVLVIIFIGATLMFIVTVMRNIQISVYHRRQKSESVFVRIINFIAAASNIFAYVGFVLVALFDLDGPGDAPRIHLIGSYMYFVLSGLYGLLHSYLLCKQSQYPIFCKIVLSLVPVAGTACSIIYAVVMGEGYEFEWFTVALGAIFVGLMSILFIVDPVDDELGDFFCCRRGKRR